VRFDNNRYSVMASAIDRPVDVHAYADRIVIKQAGLVVGEHTTRRCWRGAWCPAQRCALQVDRTPAAQAAGDR
jgi:Mu transposase-like protein